MVIEAQVKGGFKKYKEAIKQVITVTPPYASWTVDKKGFSKGLWQKLPIFILEILLDTKGCKAAYGEERVNQIWGVFPVLNVPKWEEAVMKIHWAWHSGEGNNVRAALETAVSFLPDSLPKDE